MLTTKENIKSLLDIPTVQTAYDSLIEGLINGISSFIIGQARWNLVSPKDESNAEVDVIEIVKNKDISKTLQVKNYYPLKSITKIEIESGGTFATPTYTEVDAETYIIDDTMENTIAFENNLTVGKRYRITYKGGYMPDEIPEDLKLLVNQLVCKEFNNRKSQGMTEEKVGEVDIKWGEVKLTDPQIDILNKYKYFWYVV